MNAGARVSHYRIERLLGQGGMGQVFLAGDEVLGRRVALKFIRADDAAAGAAPRRLWHEAHAAAALDHPFICKIFEVGESDEGPFIAMEYVNGQTLAHRLSSGPVRAPNAVAIASEIAEALAAAHRLGVVHRDLKPANVMLTEDGHVKIMDFGVARRLDVVGSAAAAATLSTISDGPGMPGTLPYMSPEQVLGRPVDARSDLFSFGILLYELFTGVHPFRRDTALAIASAIASEDPPPLTDTKAEDVPAGLQRILDRLLAKTPHERYQSALDVAADLRELSGAGRSKASAAAGPARALWRRTAVLAGLLLGVTVIGIVVYAILGQSPALAFQERDWLVVADFDNQTGDAAFDGALDRPLAVAIQQSRYVNVLPRVRVTEALRRAGRSPSDTLDQPLAAEVAEREGARGVLAASIARVGDAYVLTANLIAPATQEGVASITANARSKNDVLDALDELATKVRRQLGESMAAITEQRTPLMRATTSSLDALKLYCEGVRLAAIGKLEGYRLIEEAVALDPDFAMAHAALGLNAYFRNDRRNGEEHFRKALSLTGRLTVRERLWIQAVADDSRGNRETAADSYRAYVAAYPDDSDGWFRLGWTLMATLNKPDEAATAFTRAIAINPRSAGAHVNLATCYRLLRRHAESVAEYRKAFAMQPNLVHERFVNHEFGFALVIAGELDEARTTFEKLASNPDKGLQASASRSLGLLEMYRGRYAAAIEHLGHAVLLTRSKPYALTEMRNRLFVAEAARMLGQTRRVAAEMAEVDRLIDENAFEPAMLATAAAMHVRLGNLARARTLRSRMEAATRDLLASSAINRSTRLDEAVLQWTDGEIAVATGRRDEGIALLETALRLFDDINAQPPLAKALAAAGRHQDAARVYQSLIDRMPLGDERQDNWLLAHLELGKLREAMGDRDGARALYEKLLTIWKEADADLQPAADARARLAALRTN